MSAVQPGWPTTGWQWVRLVGNFVNLTTPLGLGVAVIGRAEIRRGPRGLFLCEGYRLKFPIADAFTVGSVLTTVRTWDEVLRRQPQLLRARGEPHLAVPLLSRPAVLPRVRDLHGLVDAPHQ